MAKLRLYKPPSKRYNCTEKTRLCWIYLHKVTIHLVVLLSSNPFPPSKGFFMRTDMFQQILEDLNGSSADVEASALISTDGLMIASALPTGIDEDRVGAMSAALLSLGDRAGAELGRGSTDRVLVQGEKGYVIMTSAGQEAVLTVMAKPNAKLGLIFLDIKRASEALSKLL